MPGSNNNRWRKTAKKAHKPTHAKNATHAGWIAAGVKQKAITKAKAKELQGYINARGQNAPGHGKNRTRRNRRN